MLSTFARGTIPADDVGCGKRRPTYAKNHRVFTARPAPHSKL